MQVIVLVSLGAWLLGSLAVHADSLTFYLLASVLNVIVAALLLLFHTMGNARARHLLSKIFCCCFRSSANQPAVAAPEKAAAAAAAVPK